MKFLFVFIIFLFCYYTSKSQPITVENWEKELINVIDREIENQIKFSCDSSQYKVTSKFYKSELVYFPIEESFEELKRIVKDNKLRPNDFIALRLYYPSVGYDPEIGYEANIIIFRKFRKAIFEEYDFEKSQFYLSEGNARYVKKRLKKGKSQCYGTGYLLTTLFKSDLSIKGMKIMLGLQLFH